jgi:tRNA pseudouridine32 synthase/23S rRNA pseudouridine746 synthase
MAALGMPILNDALYPQERPRQEGDYSRPLQLLAKTLAFVDPVSGLPLSFESRFRLLDCSAVA